MIDDGGFGTHEGETPAPPTSTGGTAAAAAATNSAPDGIAAFTSRGSHPFPSDEDSSTGCRPTMAHFETGESDSFDSSSFSSSPGKNYVTPDQSFFFRRPVDQSDQIPVRTVRHHRVGHLPGQFRPARRHPEPPPRRTPLSFGPKDFRAACYSPRREQAWSVLGFLPRTVPPGVAKLGSNGPSRCSRCRLPLNRISNCTTHLRGESTPRCSRNEVAREGPTVPTAPSVPLYRIRTQELVLGLARRSPEYLLRPAS